MSEKISVIRRLRLEANALGEFETYASREYRRLLLDAADEIEQLTKERDNARRDVLAHIAELKAKINTLTAERDNAKRRGWDCHKDYK